MDHRCKVCRKTFPCGRSLGGHMRSHMVASAAGDEEKLQLQLPMKNREAQGFQAAATYGLRENPKKTWRFSDSTSDRREKRCRECGREFQSWKALFGHMRSHSDKRAEEQEEEEETEQEDSWSDDGDDQFRNERRLVTLIPKRKRGSRRSATMVVAAATSSSMSEYEKEQQEDGAITLMMLSRDVGGYWGNGPGFNPVAESSDKNSAILEDHGELGLLGGGQFKKFESDEVSDDEFFKKPRVAADSDVEYYLENESDIESKKGSSFKKKHHSSFDASVGPKLRKDSERRGQFECTTCNKTFHSYQALGGHRASHKRIKGCFAPKGGNGGSEGSLETNASIDQTVGMDGGGKAKGSNNRHECVICGKNFASGQALGGHKRSHLLVSSVAVGVRRAVPMPDLLDLNLPAPGDEDSSNGKESAVGELKPWWANGSLKRGALVGMISN